VPACSGSTLRILSYTPEARRFNDGWVEVRERANTLLELIDARGLAITEQTRARVLGADDIATLRRWFLLAATAASGEAFTLGMGKATGRRGKSARSLAYGQRGATLLWNHASSGTPVSTSRMAMVFASTRMFVGYACSVKRSMSWAAGSITTG